MSLDPPPPVQWGIVLGLLVGLAILLLLVLAKLNDISAALDKVIRQGGGG